MTREQATPYISYILNDALSAAPFNAEDSSHGIISRSRNTRLIGWQCGFEPMFVAVYSYLPSVFMSEDEAIDIAKDFLKEKDWFAGEPRDPDHII